MKEILSIPTTSYNEHLVLDYIRQFAIDRGLKFKVDQFGNAYIFYNHGESSRPLVLQAHTDHPAFVVEDISKGKLVLNFWVVYLRNTGWVKKLKFTVMICHKMV